MHAKRVDPSELRLATAVEQRQKQIRARVRRGTLSEHTARSYGRAIEALVEVAGDITLDQITEEHCWCVLEKWDRPSWGNIGGSLRTSLREWGVEAMPPTSDWRPKPKQLVWDPDDYAKAFDGLIDGVDRLRAMKKPITVGLCAIFVCITGCRSGEANSLEWKNIGASWLKVNGKTGERLIPRSADITTVLDHCPRGGRWVFPAIKGKQGHIDRKNLWRWVKKCGERAGVEASPQSLRRWYASYLHRAGVPLMDGMRMLGHRSPMTHMRFYVCSAPQDIQQHAEALGQDITRGQLALRLGD